MQRIDDPSNMATKQSPLATVSPGYFRRPSVLAGDQGTIVTGDWANDVQEAIVGPILAAGIALVKGDGTQLTQAINALSATLIAGHNGIASSEVVAAHSRFASAAEVLAGALGTAAISPLRLKNAFPGSLANPGYFKVPTAVGVVTLNFGSLAMATDAETDVVLASAYGTSHAVALATGSTIAGSGSDRASMAARPHTTTPLSHVTVKNGMGHAATAYWLSLGW